MPNGSILCDLRGTTSSPDSICNCTGYGDWIWCITDNKVIKNILDAISAWGGATKSEYTDKLNIYYTGYEIPCYSRSFINSKEFKKICEANQVSLIICNESDSVKTQENFNALLRDLQA